MNSNVDAYKAHAVCIPFPLQSHVKAMLQLATILHHRGFHITFVNTEFNHRRLLDARGPSSLDGLPDFKYETIPDGLPESDPNAAQELPQLCHFSRTNFLPCVLDLVSRLPNSSIPPVSCIFSDGLNPFAIAAGEELGVPVVHFFTIPACAVMGIKQCGTLKDRGLEPLKDESQFTTSYPDTIVDGIPGMKDIRVKDLPRFSALVDPDDVVINFIIEGVEMASKSSAVIIHTFDTLEGPVLEALSSIYPPVYAIGPTPLLLDRISENLSKSIGCNFLKEETECLQWLDSKESNSVLYVNFGSIIVLKPEQLTEFAWGLANSGKQFMWVIRRDLVIGDSAALPLDFVKETEERCLISGWCPQEEVLNHPSVGGFLTHCGWNSTLESMCAGVPMICWPFFADQYMICKYICSEWGLGLAMDSDIERGEVEKLVRELMEGIKGKNVKNNAMEWKRKAHEATKEDGSSSRNLQKMIDQVLSTVM